MIDELLAMLNGPEPTVDFVRYAVTFNLDKDGTVTQFMNVLLDEDDTPEHIHDVVFQDLRERFPSAFNVQARRLSTVRYTSPMIAYVEFHN